MNVIRPEHLQSIFLLNHHGEFDESLATPEGLERAQNTLRCLAQNTFAEGATEQNMTLLHHALSGMAPDVMVPPRRARPARAFEDAFMRRLDQVQASIGAPPTGATWADRALQQAKTGVAQAASIRRAQLPTPPQVLPTPPLHPPLAPVQPLQAFAHAPQDIMENARAITTMHRFTESEFEIKALAEALKVRIHVHVGGTRIEHAPTVEEGHTPPWVGVKLRGLHYTLVRNAAGDTREVNRVGGGDCYYGSVAIGTNYRHLADMVRALDARNGPAMASICRQALGQDPDLTQHPRAWYSQFCHAVLQDLRNRTAAAYLQQAHHDSRDDTDVRVAGSDDLHFAR